MATNEKSALNRKGIQPPDVRWGADLADRYGDDRTVDQLYAGSQARLEPPPKIKSRSTKRNVKRQRSR
jgi:hypothetical protein